ncbi:MAG: SGNH/GDSL hydrolase family protein [Phycisphaerae bacterium]
MRSNRLRLPAFATVLTALLAGLCYAPPTPQTRPNPNPNRVEPGPKKPGTLRIVFFGDSITGHRPLEPYRHQYIKFADLVGMLGEAKLGEGKVEVLNTGWAGDKTTPKPSEYWPGGLGRAQRDIADLDPDIVVILFGGNDKPTEPEQIALTQKNLNKIASVATASTDRTLMLLYPDPMPRPEGKAWPLNLANPLIKKAAEQAGAKLLDLDGPMKRAEPRFGRAALANAVDGVHLAPAGEMVFAQAIYRKLDQLGWIKLPPSEQSGKD